MWIGLLEKWPRISVSFQMGRISQNQSRSNPWYQKSQFPAWPTTEEAEQSQADADDGAKGHIASGERSHCGLQIGESRHLAEYIGKGTLPGYQLIQPLLFKIWALRDYRYAYWELSPINNKSFDVRNNSLNLGQYGPGIKCNRRSRSARPRYHNINQFLTLVGAKVRSPLQFSPS